MFTLCGRICAELWWKASSLSGKLEVAKRREGIAAQGVLAEDLSRSLFDHQTQHACDELCSILKRFPYWSRGHRLLAEFALSRDDIGTAYASVHAYRTLVGETDPKAAAYADAILGRCYLRRGATEQAVPLLERARRFFPNTAPVLEDLGAAYMTMGRMEDALSALSAVPADSLSMPGQTALSYVRGKIVN